MSPNGFKTVIDINLMGSFHATRAAFAQLKEMRGSIIFISAPHAIVTQAYQLHVGAAKAGIENLMRNLVLEWGNCGIRANSIIPGPIEGSEGFKRLSTPENDELNKKLIPVRRYGTADEIGQAAVYLASPLTPYITGAMIPVDCGACLVGSAVWNQQVEWKALRKP